jgi:glycosyltransferase involved in cell wall biosynthesis
LLAALCARFLKRPSVRILYLVTRADLGGAQVHILDLLHGFRNVLEPVVGAGEEGYFTEAVRSLGVPCYVVPSLVHAISPLQDCKALYEVARLIRSTGADVVHAHTSKAGVIGRLAARAAGVPAVFTAHTWCFAEGTSWKWRVCGTPTERLAGFLSAAIINVSEANRNLALQHGIADSKRMLTIWNGIPDTVHRSRPGASGVPVIAMVARCVPQKDHSLLLRAVAGMECPARVLFAGDGPLMESLKSEATALGISGHVAFLGQRFDIPEILAGAHIFALASKWEGFPLSILEAMRAGLPVLASNVGGVSEAVTDGKTGYLVGCGDVDQFRSRLRALLEDAGLRRCMGIAGRKRYEMDFTLQQMLDKTLAVYRMAVRGTPEKIPIPARPSSKTVGYGLAPKG